MKSAHLTYWDWTWAFHQHDQLCVVLQTILFLSLKQRKAFLGLTRTQSPIITGSYLESQVACLYDNILVPSTAFKRYDDARFTNMDIRTFLTTYQSPFLSPVSASIIALAVRIVPSTTQDEYDAALQASVSKEISAAITRFPHARIDYRCIFSSDRRHNLTPFSERMPADPMVADSIYQTFVSVRSKIEHRTLLPSIGRKTVGTIVADNFWNAYIHSGCTFKHDGRFDPEDQVTTRDCLKLYEETGGFVEGPVEMRTSWKYAQIDPRVYYARGGSVIPSSQYLQPVVNQIIDAFPEVHRVNRFSDPQEPLSDSETEVIYDYSSFTSLLDAVFEFIHQMSIFFRGTPVYIIDVRDGLVERDLGQMFEQYNQDCNNYAAFDTHRVLPLTGPDAVLHHTCGMLGVEGNIFLATLLHGIHLRFIAGTGKSRCVGDDARFHCCTNGDMTESIRNANLWILSGIGDINEDKVAIFEEGANPVMQAFRYIKRPLERNGNLMIAGVLFELPSLIPLFPIHDRFHTVLPSDTHPCRATFKAIIRFLRVLKLYNINWDRDNEGVTMAADHVHFLTNEIRRIDSSSEHCPLSNSSSNLGYRLPPVKEWGKVDYEEWVMMNIGMDQVFRFLKYGGAGADNSCDGRYGSVMVRETTAERSFLEKLGYLRRVDLFDEVSLNQIGPDLMKEYLSGGYRTVCEFHVIQDIPAWYSYIPKML